MVEIKRANAYFELYVNVYGRLGVYTRACMSYLGSRGLFGRLLVRSRFSVPPDGRSGPEPGLTRLMKKKKIIFRTLSDEGEATL